MKRVCILVHNSVATDARVQNQAEALSCAGYQVTVLGVRNPHDRGDPQWLADRRWQLKLYQRDKRGLVGRWNWLHSALRSHAAVQLGQRLTLRAGVAENALIRAYPELLQLALAERADIYHANDLNTLPIACEAARLVGGRAIYDAHELYTEELPDLPDFHRRLVAFVESRYIGRASRVITVSNGIAAILRDLYAIPLPLTIYNVPPLSLLPTLPTLPQLVEGRPLSLLHHGHLGFGGRGLADLQAALPLFADGIELHLRGQLAPSARQAMEETARRHKRPLFVHPVVSPRELLRLAAGHDVGLVLTQPSCRSLSESAPNKLFQYLLAGLAVVCTELPGHAELLAGSDVALTYRPGDAAGLAAAVNSLAQDRSRLSTLRRQARALAVARYCWELEAEKLLTLYRELA